MEAKVADSVRKEKEITAFAQKVEKTDGNIAGDLDVVTNNEIIEVKASLRAVKDDLRQFDKLTDPNDVNFFNSEGKNVILYIDKSLSNLSPKDSEKLSRIKEKGVTVVNSLEELKEVLK